jgi:uncharacterized membrane protein (UPF0127 family)
MALVGVLLAAAVVAAYLYFQPTQTATMSFEGLQLTVDLARTSSQWEQGLSGRASMPQNHGMLFVFDHPDLWQFWMHGMEFPLDIIWFGANHSVVYFAQDLPTCPSNGCQTYSPPTSASYALEVNAGFIATHNVTIGDTFSLTP